jgi:hypothetical protein
MFSFSSIQSINFNIFLDIHHHHQQRENRWSKFVDEHHEEHYQYNYNYNFKTPERIVPSKRSYF